MNNFKTDDVANLEAALRYGIQEWSKSFVFFQHPNDLPAGQAGAHNGQTVLYDLSADNFVELTKKVELLNQQVSDHLSRIMLTQQASFVQDHFPQSFSDEKRHQKSDELYSYLQNLTTNQGLWHYAQKLVYVKDQASLYNQLVSEIEGCPSNPEWREITDEQIERLAEILSELYLVTNNVETETMRLFSFLVDIDVYGAKLKRTVKIKTNQQEESVAVDHLGTKPIKKPQEVSISFNLNILIGSTIQDGYYTLGANTSSLWEHRANRMRHTCNLFNQRAHGGYELNDKNYYLDLNDDKKGFKFAIHQGAQEMTTTRMILDIQQIKNLQNQLF